MNTSISERAQQWAKTMSGNHRGDHVVAHTNSPAPVSGQIGRQQLEQRPHQNLSDAATKAHGAGNRQQQEKPDRWRTCFDVDRDRILHHSSFRRLAGKTQVFVFPDDHQRTRLTHALEVAQVARGIAAALGLNVTLAEAIALGHDCGHGPGGHASEDAFDRYLPEGFNHAHWGADVTLADSNLCEETLNGIRNHSWSLPAPNTPEGEVVSWADRIAYVCHDFEDAVKANILTTDDLPKELASWAGTRQSRQIGAFISDVVETSLEKGVVCGSVTGAWMLAEFRRFNYEHIYTRAESNEQNEKVIGMLSALVNTYLENPELLGSNYQHGSGIDVTHQVIAYVAGMTDRFAFNEAIRHGSWSADQLPAGVV